MVCDGYQVLMFAQALFYFNGIVFAWSKFKRLMGIKVAPSIGWFSRRSVFK
jgi:hypothetical protein